MGAKVLITRGYGSSKQTLGIIQVISECVVTGAFVSLELPYIANKTSVSSIPVGIYDAVKFNSPSNGECILLKDVPNRSYIEIHAGNYYTDIEGCILVGKYFKDIDNDGILDVSNSGDSVAALLKLLPETFIVEIR